MKAVEEVDQLVEHLIATGTPVSRGMWPRVMVPVDAKSAIDAIKATGLKKWLPKPGKNLGITGKGAAEYYGDTKYPWPEKIEHAWVEAERMGPYEDGSGPLRHLGISFRLPEGSYTISIETGSADVPYVYGNAWLMPYAETGYEGHRPVADGEKKAGHAKDMVKIVNDLLAWRA